MESDAAKEKFELQATEKMNSIKMVLPTMSKEFMKCDPKEHKDGETYIEITKLLQVCISDFQVNLMLGLYLGYRVTLRTRWT